MLYLQQSLGIDFRDRTLRIVHLGRTFRGIVLIDYFIKKYPPPPSPASKSGVEGEPDPLALDLRNFIRERGIKPDQIVIGLPKEKVILKEILLPKVEEKQLQEILEYEVERHIPFAAQSISFDYHVLSKEENTLKILLGIVKKDELQKILNLLDLEQTKPFVVDITTIAGMNWLISQNGLGEESITAFVDIGADTVDLGLLSGRDIRITRSFNRIENRLEDPYLVEDAYEDETINPAGAARQATGQAPGLAGTDDTARSAVPAGAGDAARLSDMSGISGPSGISGINDTAKPSGLVQSWLENERLTPPPSTMPPSTIIPPSSIIPPFSMMEQGRGQNEEMFSDSDKDLLPAFQYPDAHSFEPVESFEPIDESVRALGQDIIRELDIAMNVFTDFHEEKAIDNVILTGTEAYTGNLSEYINARAGVHVRILNPLKNIKTKTIPGKISSSLSVATGLALRGLEDQPLMLNFLAEGKKNKRKTNRIAATVVLMTLIIILILGWALGLSYESNLISSGLTRRLQSLQPDVTEVKNISQELENIDKGLSMIEKVTDNEVSKMELLKELTTILPADTWLDNLAISNEKMEINGYSESASNLIPMLEISPLLENVQFGSSITKMGPGKERFKITANIERRKNADSSGKEKVPAGKEKSSDKEKSLDQEMSSENGKSPDQEKSSEKKEIPAQGEGPDKEKGPVQEKSVVPDEGKSPAQEKKSEKKSDAGKGEDAGPGKKGTP